MENENGDSNNIPSGGKHSHHHHYPNHVNHGMVCNGYVNDNRARTFALGFNPHLRLKNKTGCPWLDPKKNYNLASIG